MLPGSKLAERYVKRPLRSRPIAVAGAGKGGVRRSEASRSQMRAFFDNSPDWLTLFRATQDGRFLYEDLNRETERAYGLSRDQVIGRPLEEILGAEQAQLPLRHMRAASRPARLSATARAGAWRAALARST